MKIERRETKENGIIQVTTLDERWYIDEEDTEQPDYPSNTWICGYYYKGQQFWKWLASKGWDEAEAIKQAAGIRGSKIHRGIEALLTGNTLAMNDSLPDNDGQVTEITVEEWAGILSFADWWNSLDKPEILATEQVVICREPRWAGTLDLKLRIGEDVWIIDFKTGQNIWPEYELQVSAYRHAEKMEDVTKMGILQIGYSKNRRGWKLTEVEDKYDLFLATYAIWYAENKDVHPKQKDYPASIALKLK